MSKTDSSNATGTTAARETTAQSQQTTAVLKLRELLLRGEFAPGERMREIPLATRFGVSRTPLRLALSVLQHEGLLDLHPKRGFLVRAITRNDVLHAIEIRGLLEGMAARLVVQRFFDQPAFAASFLQALTEVTAQLDETVALLDEDGQRAMREYIVLNRQFHKMLLEAAQSEVLQREFDRIVSLPFAAPSSGFLHRFADSEETRLVLRIGQDQHHAIVDALTTRDGVRVDALLREHARLAQRNLDVALRQEATVWPSLLRVHLASPR